MYESSRINQTDYFIITPLRPSFLHVDLSPLSRLLLTSLPQLSPSSTTPGPSPRVPTTSPTLSSRSLKMTTLYRRTRGVSLGAPSGSPRRATRMLVRLGASLLLLRIVWVDRRADLVRMMDDWTGFSKRTWGLSVATSALVAVGSML